MKHELRIHFTHFMQGTRGNVLVEGMCPALLSRTLIFIGNTEN